MRFRVLLLALKTSDQMYCEEYHMNNLLEQAIRAHDGDRAARTIQDALGIGSGDVALFFPKSWPADREQRARIIGGRLHDRGASFGRVLEDARSR
jgi:hypothetical protein